MHKLYDEDSAQHSAVHGHSEHTGLEDWDEDTVALPPAAATTQQFTLGNEHEGTRLDKVLGLLVPQFSRSYHQQLLAQGLVQHNGLTAHKSAQRVRAGDTLDITLQTPPREQVWQAELWPIDWRYQDAHLGVLMKPAGLVVHPAAGNWSGTLLNALLGDYAQAHTLPRAGIVHRLDKDTSGLMLVGRSIDACTALVAQMAQREIQREYLALVHGVWQQGASHTVDAPLGRDPRNRLRMAVLAQSATAKPAQTTFTLIARSTHHSLLHCRLHTGRTHQIRVHAKHLGHALVGDSVYGGTPWGPLSRQALHAFHLQLKHPITQEPLHFAEALPPDFAQALAALGLEGPLAEWLRAAHAL